MIVQVKERDILQEKTKASSYNEDTTLRHEYRSACFHRTPGASTGSRIWGSLRLRSCTTGVSCFYAELRILPMPKPGDEGGVGQDACWGPGSSQRLSLTYIGRSLDAQARLKRYRLDFNRQGISMPNRLAWSSVQSE